ncbi:MAG: hypothetical protein RL134_1722, partial [Actinomycetota bacterium]
MFRVAVAGAIILGATLVPTTNASATTTDWAATDPGITSSGSSDWTFASSLDLNDDGSLLAVGDPDDNAAYVYSGAAGAWSDAITVTQGEDQPCSGMLNGFGDGVQFDANDDLLVSSMDCGAWEVPVATGPALFTVADGAVTDEFYEVLMLDEADTSGVISNDGTLIAAQGCNTYYNGSQWMCTPAVEVTQGPSGSWTTLTGTINLPGSCDFAQQIGFIGDNDVIAVCSTSDTLNTDVPYGGAVYVSTLNATGYSSFGSPLTSTWTLEPGGLPAAYTPSVAVGGSVLATGDGSAASVQVSTWDGSAWASDIAVTLDSSDSCLGASVDVAASGTVVVASDPCLNTILVLTLSDGTWQQEILPAPTWVDYVAGEVTVSGDGSVIAYTAVPASNDSLIAIGSFVASAGTSGASWQDPNEPLTTPAVVASRAPAKPAAIRGVGTLSARATAKGIIVTVKKGHHRHATLTMRVRTADGTFLDAAHLQTTRTAKGAHRAFTWGA